MPTDRANPATPCGIGKCYDLATVSANVIHVGEDYWHRLQVLQTSGVSAEICRDVAELASVLRTGTDAHAVLVSESRLFDHRPIPAIVRSIKKCPVILFSLSPIVQQERDFDLVIPPLATPYEWLPKIHEITAQTMRLCAQSRARVEESRRRIRDTRKRIEESSQKLNGSGPRER